MQSPYSQLQLLPADSLRSDNIINLCSWWFWNSWACWYQNYMTRVCRSSRGSCLILHSVNWAWLVQIQPCRDDADDHGRYCSSCSNKMEFTCIGYLPAAIITTTCLPRVWKLHRLAGFNILGVPTSWAADLFSLPATLERERERERERENPPTAAGPDNSSSCKQEASSS
jgi:hypothetical protein